MVSLNKFKILIILFLLTSELYSWVFYLNNFSAETKSMAEAYFNSTENADSIIINPSLLLSLKFKTFQWSSANLFGSGIYINSFSAAFPIKNNELAIGINFSILGTEEQPVTDVARYQQYGGATGEGILLDNNENPIILGYFSEHRSGLYFTISKKLFKKLDAGLTLKRYSFYYNSDEIQDKYINALLNTESSCISVDTGLSYLFLENFKIGFTLYDVLNTGFEWDAQSEYILRLDPQFSLNIECDKIKNLRLAGRVLKIISYNNYQIKFGAEYNFLNFLRIRAGYNNNFFTTGLGLRVKSEDILKYLFSSELNKYSNKLLKIDYSIEFNSILGNTHTISLGINF